MSAEYLAAFTSAVESAKALARVDGDVCGGFAEHVARYVRDELQSFRLTGPAGRILLVMDALAGTGEVPPTPAQEPKCPWCKFVPVTSMAMHKGACEVGRLRDRFAMAALTGMMSAAEVAMVRAQSSSDAQRIVAESNEVDRARASHAFRLADAMLAAREATS